MCWQVKEEEKENKQLKEENLLMTNKTETLKVSESKINEENFDLQNTTNTEFLAPEGALHLTHPPSDPSRFHVTFYVPVTILL